MTFDTVAWTLARGAGFAAFALLTVSVCLGLMMSLRIATPRWPMAITRNLHEHVAALGLWTLGAHVVLLIVDSQSGISPIEAMLPWGPEYRPLATTLGILAMYAVVAVTVTSRLRRRIGHTWWRKVHTFAFAAYVAALLHGILAGTDTGAGWASALYAASALTVSALMMTRWLRSTPPAPAERIEATSPPPLPPLT